MAINPFWMNAFGQNVANAGSGPVPRGVMAAEPTTGNGLFGANPEQRDMLLTLGMNLLAGSGYSPQKRTTGEILGSAMLAAQQSQAATRDRMMKQRLQEAQIAAAEREAAQGPSLGALDVDAYEPASVDLFKQSGNFSDLKPRADDTRTTSQRDFEFFQSLTPDQQKQYMALQRQPTVPRVIDYQGGKALFDPLQRTVTPLSTADAEAAAQATIAEEKAVGAARGEARGGLEKKGVAAQSVLGKLDLAEPLIDLATGSTAGAAVDKVAGFFGKSLDGAQATAQLKILQADLMTNMPRMEGPQSDRDVQLYREAAGEIGDPKVPRAQKRAAVQMIRALQQKYAEGVQRTPQQSSKPAPERVRSLLDKYAPK